MTAAHKDPRAVIEQLVDALQEWDRVDALGREPHIHRESWKHLVQDRNIKHSAALTAGREALAEQREVGYGLYLEFNGELHLEYPIEASYGDCVLRLQEYEGNRGYEIRACYIIPTGLEK